MPVLPPLASTTRWPFVRRPDASAELDHGQRAAVLGTPGWVLAFKLDEHPSAIGGRQLPELDERRVSDGGQEIVRGSNHVRYSVFMGHASFAGRDALLEPGVEGSGSARGDAAVSHQIGPGDVGRLFGRQEQDAGRDFLGTGGPLQHAALAEAADELFHRLAEGQRRGAHGSG